MTPKKPSPPVDPQTEPSQQAAFYTLNDAIVRLAVRRERPVDPRSREEFRGLVDAALEAYRNYMRLAAV
jgi:hypothetical protein